MSIPSPDTGPRPAVHVVLVSDQAIPNLTPVLDPAFQPREIVLVVSPDKAARAKWLEAVLIERGIRCREWPIEDAWDIEHVKLRVWELLEAAEGDDVALNATGGTKPMSIAAYEVFRDWNLPIFYVHPEQDRVIWLHPSDEPSFRLADRVRLETFLSIHGAVVEGDICRNRVEASRLEVSNDLVRDLARYRRALRTLNFLAHSADNPSFTSARELDDDQMDSMALRDLIDRFGEAQLLSLDGRRLRFPDEDSRFFVNGGWLEEYVYGVIEELKSERRDIQDSGRQINVRRETPRGVVPNELDVALLADNRFYLVECKTRSWARSGPEEGPGAEAIYKLDSLRDLLGGLQARAMLVSYQDVKKYDHSRAHDLGIRVCAGLQVQDLKATILDWIGKAKD